MENKKLRIEELGKRIKTLDKNGFVQYVDISEFKMLSPDQDKISFAVEQLEKVKEFANKEKAHDFISEIVYIDDLFNYIDNQIKQLKEGK